jgi:aconitate hydratase
MVAAIAISGRLDFNPITDSLINSEGNEVKLDEPTGWELPPKDLKLRMLVI